MGGICCQDIPDNEHDFKDPHKTLYSDTQEDKKKVEELKQKLAGNFLNHFRDTKDDIE